MRDEMSLSDVEPELGAIEAYQMNDEPPFPLVIRGYDRRAVDEYLELTAARLAEYEALQLPSVAVKEALERVADDTGGILKEAHETADGVMTRARDEAERLVREAREEADRTIASAEARVRQIGIDTDALWQERLRLIEDAQATSVSLAALAEEAIARFPAWDPEEEAGAVEHEDSGVVTAEPVDGLVEPADDEAEPLEDDIVEQPTEAFDVAEMLAAEEDAEAGPEPSTAAAEHEKPARPTGDWLDDLQPPPEFGR
jgi:cell division septum initiation protein DivIVA